MVTQAHKRVEAELEGLSGGGSISPLVWIGLGSSFRM